MTDRPGRHCPTRYRTTASDLRNTQAVAAQTLYIIGGLYGNHAALGRILEMVNEERKQRLPAPILVFNGDFNWFNADRTTFHQINQTVLQHLAVSGNVEMELAEPSSGAGCGCAYPPHVNDDVVQRSNEIMTVLQSVAATQSQVTQQLARLPLNLKFKVGDLNIGVVHGDPDSVAGWGLALENMPDVGSDTATIRHWFSNADVDVFASTHTCVAYMQDFEIHGRRRLVVNNGAAGMPNFHGDLRGLISRISIFPSIHNGVYGTRSGGVFFDALPVAWDNHAWQAWFNAHWPKGSPAAESYGSRIHYGPDHSSGSAFRIA